MQPTLTSTIIPANKRKTALLELIAAGFTVAGIFMVRSPDLTGRDHLYAWACVALFGLCFVLIVPQLLGKNYLLLNEQGFRIVSPYNKKFFFAWSDIDSIGAYTIKVRYGRGPNMIGFNLKNPSTGIVGTITEINKSSTDYQRGFVNSYSISTDELVRLMEQYRQFFSKA